MNDVVDATLLERFAAQADPLPGPNLVDVHRRAADLLAEVREGRRWVRSRRRRRVWAAILAAVIGVGGAAGALAYRYLGPSPGFTAGFSPIEQLPPAPWPASMSPLRERALRHVGISAAEAEQRLRLVQAGLTLGPGRSQGQGELYALVGEDGTSACVWLLGQGGTCTNDFPGPGVLWKTLPGYPGQTPVLTGIVTDNIDSVGLVISGERTEVPIVNNSFYTDLNGYADLWSDFRPLDPLLEVRYADGSTKVLHLYPKIVLQTPR